MTAHPYIKREGTYSVNLSDREEVLKGENFRLHIPPHTNRIIIQRKGEVLAVYYQFATRAGALNGNGKENFPLDLTGLIQKEIEKIGTKER